MKTIISALALIVALPAAANAQATQPDAHAQHQGMDHGKEHKDCCEHKNADGTPMKCCAEAMKDGKKMACCDKHGEKGEHAGHDMSKH